MYHRFFTKHSTLVRMHSRLPIGSDSVDYDAVQIAGPMCIRRADCAFVIFLRCIISSRRTYLWGRCFVVIARVPWHTWGNTDIYYQTYNHLYSLFFYPLLTCNHLYLLFFYPLFTCNHMYSLFFYPLFTYNHLYSLFFYPLFTSNHMYSLFFYPLSTSNHLYSFLFSHCPTWCCLPVSVLSSQTKHQLHLHLHIYILLVLDYLFPLSHPRPGTNAIHTHI